MSNVDTINCNTNIRAYYVNDKHKKMSYTCSVYDMCTQIIVLWRDMQST